jgi:acyl-CoA dehydrogenase
MDFTPDEAQQAVADLADQIMGDRLDMERLLAIEEALDRPSGSRGAWFDADLWASLATAGLVGIALGEDVGGGGLDAVALAVLLRAQGNHVAPLPLLPHGVASLAVDRFGNDEQRQRLLPGCADGSHILTVAVQEYLDDRIREPGARVVDGALHGTKIVVEAADLAGHAVVTAAGDDDPGLFLVDLAGGGIDIGRTEGRSTRLEPVWQLEFDGTPVEPLGDVDAAPVDWLVDHLLMAICATQLGVTERALRLTAEYTSEREQFGRPLATFQAVTQRLADQFINVGGIRLATLSAAWRLAQGLDAREDLLIAKWWASERATEVAHATQHCHGGMGVAKDYPLHRYTLWNKHLTTSLGAGTQSLRALGSLLAEA